MRIEKIDGSCVYLSLDPQQCLAIADACYGMAEHLDDSAADTPTVTRLECAFYRALGSTFHGYALVGHAGGRITAEDAAGLTAASARQEWGVRPRDRSKK